MNKHAVLLLPGLVAGLAGAVAAADPPPLPEPPVTIALDAAYAGTVAIAVSRPDGALVRRVVAERRLTAGRQAIGWDLLDEDGKLMPPGTYRWTAVTVPDLKLTYEGTVNDAGLPPWPAPVAGGGQWLADHSPPQAVCAVGDLIFIGAACAESGHAAIAIDHDGRKRWGVGQVGGPWHGAQRIATDGRYAYLANADVVVRVDPNDGFATRDVLHFVHTADLPGPAFPLERDDIAVRGDRLFVAVDAASVALRGCAEAAKLDLAACQPPLAAHSGSEDEYSPAQRWQAAMALTGAAASSAQAALGPTFDAGALAGTCTAVFTTPVPVASLLLADAGAEAWALKPDADPAAAGIGATGPGAADAAEGDPFDEELWQPIHVAATAGGAALETLETPVRTRALRFRSARPLDFAVPFDRRWTDVAPAATVASADGRCAPGGAWSVERDPTKLPIAPSSQPALLLTWPAAQTLRGVALVRPDEAYFAVDVWTGAGAPDAEATTWREVGAIGAEMFGPRPQRPTLRLIDFGGDIATSALRVRAVHPAGHRGYMGGEGMPVTGVHHAGFAGVVAFHPLGGDLADLPPDLSQRLSEYRLTADGAAQLVRHLPLRHPGRLAFAPDGALWAVSDGAVVTVDPATGATRPVISAAKLDGPTGMAFDRDGNLLLIEQGACGVGVWSRDGKRVRQIGEIGARGVGAFAARRFVAPASVAVGADGAVWIAEAHFTPKRVTRWSADGATLERELYGPAQYGGGGWLDPRDPTLVYYRGMKFRFDWKTRASALEAIVFAPGVGGCLRTAEPDRVVYRGDRRYLVGDGGPVVAICVEQDGVARPIAAAGNLGAWGDVDADPALRARFGHMNRGALGFVWSDRNGDRAVQPDEVQVTPAKPFGCSGNPDVERVGEDLALRFGDCRLRPTGFTADGVPLYDVAKLETGLPTGWGWEQADGSAVIVGEDGVRALAADGVTTRWLYPDRYRGVHGSHHIGYDRAEGQLVGSSGVVGHLAIGEPAEDLMVVAGNHGDWFAFTADGLLAACLSGGPLDRGKRFWTFPECEPGKTDLSGLCLGEEHFGGSVVRAADGRVLMVAGHNHNSLVRVDGLERIRRAGGELTVTADDIARTGAYMVQRQVAERARAGERKLVMPWRESAGIEVDGKLGEWDPGRFVTIEERYDDTARRRIVLCAGGLAADAEHLYIAGHVADQSPLLNSATDPVLAFKGGDAFDVTLGLDQAAPPDRTNAVAGDVRVLLVPGKERSYAVVYRPVVPGTAPERRRVLAATGRTELDEAGIIADARVVFAHSDDGWTVEAEIPWRALGTTPEAGQRLRADLGVLKSDQNGVATVMRTYWAGKSQTLVSDVGFESRLTPALWGDADVVAEEAPALELDGVRTR